MSKSQSPFFVDLGDQGVIYLQFRFLQYELKTYSIGVFTNTEFIDIGRTLSIWVPTGKFVEIEGDNCPLIEGCGFDSQLSVNNATLIKMLYDDAKGSNLIKKTKDGCYVILIFDEGKMYNSFKEKKFVNRWTVYNDGDIPKLEDVLKEAFRKQYLK